MWAWLFVAFSGTVALVTFGLILVAEKVKRRAFETAYEEIEKMRCETLCRIEAEADRQREAS